jgi:signal transduction histidine kinase
MELPLEKTISPQSAEKVMAILQEELAREGMERVDPKRFRTVEIQQQRKDGTFGWAEATMTFLRDEEGRPVEIIGVTRDITERKLWEHQIEKKAGELEVLNSLGRQMGADLSVESVLKTALEHMSRSVDPDLSMVFMKDGENLLLKRVESGNGDYPDTDLPVHRVGECLCGLAAQEATAVYSKNIHTDPRCTLEECKTAGLLSFAALPLMSAGQVIGVLGIASHLERDFEEQAPFMEALTNEVAMGLKNAMLYKKAQADASELQTSLNQIQVAEREKEELTKQLYQAQKMEAIGTLAGGIAHDFNNILAPIIMGAELALMTTPVENQAHPMMQKVLSSGLRAKDLVQQILTFSRQSDLERSLLRVGPIVKETVKLARASLPATIEIRRDIDVKHDLVLANPTQVHQLMMNLITNAAHAMRPKGGVLEVLLKDQYLDDAAVAAIPEITAGHYVRLVAKDTGHGIGFIHSPWDCKELRGSDHGGFPPRGRDDLHRFHPCRKGGS